MYTLNGTFQWKGVCINAARYMRNNWACGVSTKGTAQYHQRNLNAWQTMTDNERAHPWSHVTGFRPHCIWRGFKNLLSSLEISIRASLSFWAKGSQSHFHQSIRQKTMHVVFVGYGTAGLMLSSPDARHFSHDGSNSMRGILNFYFGKSIKVHQCTNQGPIS